MAGTLLRSVSTNVSNSGFLFRRRVVLWVLLAGVLALVWSYRNRVSTDRLDQLASAARARGLPASWSDLERQYPFQSGAYSYFLSLNSLITGLPRPPASAYAAAMGLTNSGRPVSSEVVAWMERNEATATQLQPLLLDGVNGDFGVRRAAMGVDFPPTASDHQAAVTLMRTRAEWAVERGQMDAGGAALIAAVRLIRYNGGDYSLIGFIVRQSEIKSTHDSVQNLWAPGRGRLTDPQLRDLQRAFAQLLEAPTLSVVLRIDWAAHMDLLRSGSNWMPELFGNSTRRDEFIGFLVGCAYVISGSRSADVYDYLRISDARCEASQGPLAQRQQRSQALDAESAGILKKWNRPLFRAMVFNFSSLNRKELWATAWVRTVVTTLAVERFRLKYGQLPVNTAALVPEFLPEVLFDPIDEKPLRYRREAEGFVVYSIGANGRDDEGQLGPVENEDSSAMLLEGDQGIRVK